MDWQPLRIKDDLKYSPTDGNDFIAVRGGEDCHGGKGSDDFVIREANHLRIGDFFSGDDDLVFDTGLGLTSRDHLVSFIHEIRQEGDNFVVDFGPGISITLVGVHSNQISWDDVSVLSQCSLYSRNSSGWQRMVGTQNLLCHHCLLFR